MAADGSKPTPNKRFYDIFSWLVTQLAFSYTVAPFVLLTFTNSTLVWARVYFYCIVGVTACSLFLASPGKQWLQSKVQKKNSRPTLVRSDSQDGHPTLGLPNDPGQEWDNMVDEIRQEIEIRKQRGQPISESLKRDAAKVGLAKKVY